MNKKAQFFLIAALIIAGIIIALSQTFTSSSVQPQQTLTYDLSNQVYYESSQVIDNGVFNSKPQDIIAEELSNLTQYYSSINPDSDIVIIYGNGDNLQEIKYNYDTGKSTPEPAVFTSEDAQFITDKSTNTDTNKKIRVTINSKDNSPQIVRDFEVQKGQNLYIVIKKKIKNEQFVISK